jgi:site-specific recombinase XerD
MHELQISVPANSSEFDALIRQASTYFDLGKSIATRKSYASDVRQWKSFCAEFSISDVPAAAGSVALYASRLAVAHLTVATINRKIAALCFLHRQMGFEEWPATIRKSHVLREVLAGIVRTHGAAQVGARALSPDEIRRIVTACPNNLLGHRDRALFLVGFSAGSRRNELASVMQIRDLVFTDQGMTVSIRHDKTNPLGDHPRTIAIPFGEHEETCPVKATRAWLDAAVIGGDNLGPVFRAVDRWGNASPAALNPRSIAKILAAAIRRAGIDTHNVSPHSLRAGFCTTASRNGASEREISKTTGHRSNVVRRYIQDADLFEHNASRMLGL